MAHASSHSLSQESPCPLDRQAGKVYHFSCGAFLPLILLLTWHCPRVLPVVPGSPCCTESLTIVPALYDQRKGIIMHSFSKAACGLALLTGAGFLAAPAAHAQNPRLTLGQSGSTTLSGTGTLTDTGTTASGTFTYFDDGTGVALANQNSYYEWYAYGPSTANITGGTITHVLYTYDTSTANVTGGSLQFLFTNDSSTANVSGGNIRGLFIDGTSTANITGGGVTQFESDGTGNTNFSGGSFLEVLVRGASMATVTGGDYTSTFETAGTATANITGGTFAYLQTDFSSTINVRGGILTNILYTYDTSTLDLFGSGFTETLLNPNQYAVTGTLQNGDPLNTIYDDFGGTLEFNGIPAAVPEASSMVSLGLLLLLGIGGMAVSRRRRAGC